MRKWLAELLYHDRDRDLEIESRRNSLYADGIALKKGNHPILVDGYCAIDSLKMQLRDEPCRLDYMCLTHEKLTAMFILSKEIASGRKFFGTLPKSHRSTPNIVIEMKADETEKVLNLEIKLKHNYSKTLLETMLRYIVVNEKMESEKYRSYSIVGVFRGDIVQYATNELLFFIELGFEPKSGTDKESFIIESKKEQK